MTLLSKLKNLKWKKILFSFVFLSFLYVLGHNFPVPEITPDKTETSRIIFVPGIKTWDFYLWGWKRDLPKKFPNAEIIFLDDVFYLHFQSEKTEKIVEQGVAILNDGKPTKIIAHSFGGILSRAMIDQAQNANIEKLVTMASPHDMTIWGVGNAKRKLNIPATLPEKLDRKTFGGYLDPVVPCVWTELKNGHHENIFSEHLGFLLFKKIRARMLEAI